MRLLLSLFALLLLFAPLANAQFDSFTHNVDRVDVAVSFTSTPSTNCTVELRSISGGTSLGRQTCDPVHNEFANVPRGEYLLVMEMGMSETEQQVSADMSHTSVTVTLPVAKTQDEEGQATVSVKEMLIPEKARKLISKANDLVTKSKFGDAKKYVQEALAIAPSYARASALQALIDMTSHENASALVSADAAVKSDPQLPYAQFVRASVLNSMAKFADAKTAAERGLLQEENSWQGHFELAQAFTGLNDLPNALKEITKAESAAPAHFFPMEYLRAVILIRSHAMEEASRQVKNLEATAGHDPRVAQLQHLLASAQTAK